VKYWTKIGALVVTLALFGGGGTPTAKANGTGPHIALGAVTGTSLAVNATTTAADSYKGFNLHIHAELLGGVALTSITANDVGTVLPSTNAGDPFCTGSTPAGLPTDKVFACTALADPRAPGADGTTAIGLLGAFTIVATGNGCIDVSLVDDQSATLGTFTVNESDASRQLNTVDVTAKSRILIGTGCGPTPTSSAGGGSTSKTRTPTAVPTSTQAPAAAATPPTSTPVSAVLGGSQSPRRGPIGLPDTGQGGAINTHSYALAVLTVLAVLFTAGGLVSAAALRRRQ
jgi:hypothetical protein